MEFTLSRLLHRQPVTLEREASAIAAAQLMRQHHVGAVVVVESKQPGAKPVGILTDRDLVVEILAQEADPQIVSAGDLIGDRLISLPAGASAFEAIVTMRHEGVRRLVVLDESGGLAGLVGMDDLLAVVSAELLTLARVIPAEIGAEKRRRPGL